jgi:hypothetical protein
VRIVVADSVWARLLGLALRRRPPDYALLLPRCRSVHTFGMRFPLDLVWLDRGGRPVRVDEAVPPWRVRSCRRAVAVLEAGRMPGPDEESQVLRELVSLSGLH